MEQTESSMPQSEGAPARRAVVCPYCGQVNAPGAKECEKCRGLFEPLSRQASQNAMGPWYVRDEGNPFRPGCSYETMKMLVARKRVGPETVMRGPSTRQFWMAARSVPGVAHLLGECHACHRETSPGAGKCGACGASFKVEEDRQYLGLAEVRVVPGPGVVTTAKAARAAPSAAAAAPVERELPAIEDETRRDGEGLGAPEAEHATAYEPVRHPARAARGGPALSDAQIDEMLQLERQAARYGSRGGSKSVIIGLIVAAVLGIGVVIAYAVWMMGQNAGKGAGAGTGGVSSPGGASGTSAPAGPVKPVGPAAPVKPVVPANK